MEDITFLVLAADDQPNFGTISDFCRIHLKTLEGFFEQLLKIALEAGALKWVSLDGTKIEANASKHKAMSYDRMKKMEKALRSRIKDLLAQAKAGMRKRVRLLLSPTPRNSRKPATSSSSESREAAATLQPRPDSMFAHCSRAELPFESDANLFIMWPKHPPTSDASLISARPIICTFLVCFQ